MSQNNVPAVPNLPLPASEFSQQYLNVLTNVLRLYFNQLNNSVSINTNDINSSTALIWLDI